MIKKITFFLRSSISSRDEKNLSNLESSISYTIINKQIKCITTKKDIYNTF
ncbi:hypothetical protein HanIR_Chr11g0520651 [Helianthus annuus]|nr:hypothetical protein HanIR_Chr11g0520651 [Helianthus annuus]